MPRKPLFVGPLLMSKVVDSIALLLLNDERAEMVERSLHKAGEFNPALQQWWDPLGSARQDPNVTVVVSLAGMLVARG